MKRLRDAESPDESATHSSQRQMVHDLRQAGEQLCNRCSEIDFDSAFNTKTTYRFGVFIARLSHFAEPWSTSACSTCRLFAAVKPESSGPFDLYAFSSQLVFQIEISKHYKHENIAGLTESTLLAVGKRREERSIPRNAYLEDLRQTGFIFSLKDPAESTDRFCGRLLDPENANFELIHNAIEVMRKLQCQYLWVDRYCILQDDPVVKAAQIQQMGTIYHNDPFHHFLNEDAVIFRNLIL